MIRGSFHSVFQVTQLDDRTTEINWGFHINFGGKLPKVVVNSVIIPNFNRGELRMYHRYSATFTNSSLPFPSLLGSLRSSQPSHITKSTSRIPSTWRIYQNRMASSWAKSSSTRSRPRGRGAAGKSTPNSGRLASTKFSTFPTRCVNFWLGTLGSGRYCMK